MALLYLFCFSANCLSIRFVYCTGKKSTSESRWRLSLFFWASQFRELCQILRTVFSCPNIKSKQFHCRKRSEGRDIQHHSARNENFISAAWISLSSLCYRCFKYKSYNGNQDGFKI